MTDFTISASKSGTTCWCGREALMTRHGHDIESHYCADHFHLWFENALSGAPELIIRQPV